MENDAISKIINKQQAHWEKAYRVTVPDLGTNQVILPEKQQLFLKEKGKIKSSNWDAARAEIPVFLPVKALKSIPLIILNSD